MFLRIQIHNTMKKAFNVGKAICNQTASSYLLNSARYLSTQTVEPTNRSLKVEREHKSIKVDILPSIISDRKIATVEDWKAIRDELFKSGRPITSVNIDTLILNFCMYNKNYTLAYSYFDFLKKEELKPNLATIGKYFKLFYLTNCNRVVDENEELNIINLYNELRKSYKVLDSLTCDNVIYALSLTKNWRECLKLLEESKITCDPGAGAYSVTVSSAFTNGENELGWKILNEAINDKNRTPLPRAYLSYLEQCEKASSQAAFVMKIERLFEFFKRHDIKCDNEVAENINKIYKKFNLNPKITRIDARGSCLNCRQKLDKFELSRNEFENLKNAVLKNVIVGKNVFYRTTPSELKYFREFVADMKQYDVVIDGLNVAYCAGTKQPSSVFASLLASVVKHFASQEKKILVLGRTHMQKWSQKNWNYVTENADTFLTQSLSQDDPYLLYCALNSGLNTIIVTKDLMRSHLFKLKDPRLKVLFNQWLMQSQYQLQHVDNRGRVFFKYPLPYIRTPQKYQDCWHIPYIENDEDKWLCLKR